MRILLAALAFALAATLSPPAADPVALLQQRIDSGEVKLEFDPDHGYLPAVLAAMDIPTASQGLVFSRTSLQVDRIAPWTPRALYFNDDVYVGWVQGGPMMEVAAVDPSGGAVFYTLNQEHSSSPRFERQGRTCLQCHQSAVSTNGVPGFIMRSVVSDRHGYPVSVDTGATTDATPLGRRWGGWYVTGGLGTLQHMGNVTTRALKGEMGNVDIYLSKTPAVSNGGATDLSARFDVEPYLAPHSDAVALLVLAHQTSVHNLIALTHAEATKALALNNTALTPAVRNVADRLLRALLFSREAPYTARVVGSSGFAEEFSRRGPRDANGHSLRDLDLEHRLFRYPLSYLIYSDAFDALPAEVTTYLASRLRTILDGTEASTDYTHLSAVDRTAIREILMQTKPALLN